MDLHKIGQTEDNWLQVFVPCQDVMPPHMSMKSKHGPQVALALQVLLNEKAQEVASRQYKLTRSGRSISADKVYVCTGGKPNTAFLQASSTRSILDQRGYVKVSVITSP